MKNLYFDCSFGAAGDLIMSALYELLQEKDKSYFIDKMNDAGIPTVHFDVNSVNHYGIDGTRIKVTMNGDEEKQGISRHQHHAASMEDIKNIVMSLKLPQNVKDDVMAVYKIIADAESKVHQKEVGDVHFHEVGRDDAIADIAGVSLLINMLSPDFIYSTAVTTGYGKVICAHGELDVPAPATELILDDMLSVKGNVEGELSTPTGVALVKYYSSSYIVADNIPKGKSGIGFGTKDFGVPTYFKSIMA